MAGTGSPDPSSADYEYPLQQLELTATEASHDLQWPGQYFNPTNLSQFMLPNNSWSHWKNDSTSDGCLGPSSQYMDTCDVLDITDTMLTNPTDWAHDFHDNQNQGSTPSECDSSFPSSSASDYTAPPQTSIPSPRPARRKPGRPRKDSTAESIKTTSTGKSKRSKGRADEAVVRSRIREKNRIAADKCRGRQRIATEQLNAKYDRLEDENKRLSAMLNELLAERYVLKNTVIQHGGCGNVMIDNYLKDAAEQWVKRVETESVRVEAA
ncbi:hypothetical protein PT974_10051 [Cladobotryum mycophilum]|uniref:BZIP domain-containing protein n=1 Tax=Cladobotryum mycophilum TaxID=491253 RepID=A0ABR0S8S4_9HYPO